MITDSRAAWQIANKNRFFSQAGRNHQGELCLAALAVTACLLILLRTSISCYRKRRHLANPPPEQYELTQRLDESVGSEGDSADGGNDDIGRRGESAAAEEEEEEESNRPSARIISADVVVWSANSGFFSEDEIQEDLLMF
jgi:hypothetical protein